METLKTHPTTEVVAPRPPEIAPVTPADTLSQAEVDEIVQSYEQDFQGSAVEQKERKEKSVHEQTLELTHSIAADIDTLLAASKDGMVKVGNLTITKLEGDSTLAQEYERVGVPVEGAVTYKINRSENRGTYTRSESATISFANGNASVSMHSQDRDREGRRFHGSGGWGGAVWFADGQPDMPDYKNDPYDDKNTQHWLEWIGDRLHEPVERVRQHDARTKGQRILHALGYGR